MMVSTLAADEWCWPESKLLLYLQLLASSIKGTWDLNTKDLLSFCHSYNLDLGISCVLILFSNFHLGILCGRRVWGVLSQLVTPESRHFCPQKHPRHVISGHWSLNCNADIRCYSLLGCVCMCIYSHFACAHVLCV